MAIQISSNYYSGFANRRASANSAWFNQYRANMPQAGGATGGAFDYNAALRQTNNSLNQYKNQVKETTQLRKDSAEFLKNYTKSMKTLDSAAGALRGANLDRLVGETSAEGKLSEENLKKTTDAVQSMVDAYNSTLRLLNQNAERGSGVVQQIGRMAADPTNQATMDLVGVSVEKDGALKLDVEKLAGALTGAAASDAKTGTSNQMRLIKNAIGGNTGLAAGVQFDARMGQSASAGSLISNDLAKLEQAAKNNPISFDNLYSRSGSYNMMNMGAVGVLMNVIA